MAEIYTPYLVVTSGKASQMHENLKNVLICILANNKVYSEHAVIIIASTSDSMTTATVGGMSDRQTSVFCAFLQLSAFAPYYYALLCKCVRGNKIKC